MLLNKTKCPQRGFTFVEILAAMMFMAILIPAIIQGLTTAGRAGIAAERKRLAAELADRKLTEIMAEESWRQGNMDGDFDDEEGTGDSFFSYRWEMETNAWEIDAMRLVSVRVIYAVQEREYSVELSAIAPEEVTFEE